MGAVGIDDRLVDRLYAEAGGERWQLSVAVFKRALEASAAKAFEAGGASPHEVARYLSSLHLADLALACACAEGDEPAWEHFVRELRPSLYRAADRLDPGGGLRAIADSIYADLYGLPDRAGQRQPLLRYFHGRSSLATWLRAVLAQRLVDAKRTERRMLPLPDTAAETMPASGLPVADPARFQYVELVRRALGRAIGDLPARDRLRLGCYYAQELTLAETGRLLGEHEATASRHLARTRRTLRDAVERQLRTEAGFDAATLAECLRSVVDDAGPIDLAEMLGARNDAANRSEVRGTV